MDLSNVRRPPFAPTHRGFTSDECAEIVRRAAPYYIKQLSSISYYAALADNTIFWANYTGSRIVAAYELIEREEGFSLPDAVITYPDSELTDAERNQILAKPLWSALSNGDLTALQLSLSDGADPNEPHPYYGNPPLYVAINRFDEPLRLLAVSSLLRVGANARGISKNKASMLFLAYVAKDVAVMKLLLDHGADPNSLMDGGNVIYDHAEIDYRYQQYGLEVPLAPSEADILSEQSWLEYLERIAAELEVRPPALLRLLWDNGARPRLHLLERTSGTREEQEERAAARFDAAVRAANERSQTDLID